MHLQPTGYFRPYLQTFRRLLATVFFIPMLITALTTGTAAQGNFGYPDVNGHWAQGIIELMTRIEVVAGFPDGNFRPDEPVSRLDFTVFMVRASGAMPAADPQLSFTDADKIPAEFRGYIATALAEGLINGFPDNTFRPTAPITRAQMATILGRALGKLGMAVDARWFYPFQDRDQIPTWAAEASIAVKTRIITGRVFMKVFAPMDATTRAEATVMIYRFMEKQADLAPDSRHPGSVPPPSRKSYLVGGYYWANDINPGRPHETLTAYGRFIDMGILPTYELDANGNFAPGAYDSQFLFQWGESGNRQVLALVKNLGFRRDVVHQLLADAKTREQAIESIFTLMGKGYDGVNIDFENVAPEDRDLYTAFVRQLSARLRPARYLVTLSVPAKTWDNPAHGWSGAFDYQALAPLVDYLMPMAYDEHWSTGIPGPVASYPWMERVAKYTASAVPADKVMLGLPVYGYDWPEVTSGPQPAARGLSAYRAVEQAREKGVTISFDEGSKTPFYRYQDGGQNRVVHFSDERSLRFQLELVKEHGFAGIIFWRLGFEVPEIWPVIGETLR